MSSRAKTTSADPKKSSLQTKPAIPPIPPIPPVPAEPVEPVTPVAGAADSARSQQRGVGPALSLKKAHGRRRSGFAAAAGRLGAVEAAHPDRAVVPSGAEAGDKRSADSALGFLSLPGRDGAPGSADVRWHPDRSRAA